MTALNNIAYPLPSSEEPSHEDTSRMITPTSAASGSGGSTSSAGVTPELQQQVEALKYFLNTAPASWDSGQNLRRFLLPNGEYISCVLWHDLFHITGTDIVRAMVFRFQAHGRPVRNMKKFEEGIFSDLRNLKPGVDASLEDPRSPFLEMLYKNSCIRTQKKQKVFYWFSVPHDSLFTDALERDLKREALGQEPTTVAVSPAEASASFLPSSLLHTAHRTSVSSGAASTLRRENPFSVHPRVNTTVNNDSWPTTPDYGSPAPSATIYGNGSSSARFSDNGNATLYSPDAARGRSTSTSGLITGLDALMMRSDSVDENSQRLPTPRYLNPLDLYRSSGSNDESTAPTSVEDLTISSTDSAAVAARKRAQSEISMSSTVMRSAAAIEKGNDIDEGSPATQTYRDSDPYAGHYGQNDHIFLPMSNERSMFTSDLSPAMVSETFQPMTSHVAPEMLTAPTPEQADPAPMPRAYSMSHELYSSPNSDDGLNGEAASLRSRRRSTVLLRRGQRRGSVGSKSPTLSESRIGRVKSMSAAHNRDRRGPRNFGSILNAAVGATSSPLSAAVTPDDDVHSDVEVLHSVSGASPPHRMRSSSPTQAAPDDMPSDDFDPFSIGDDIAVKTEYLKNMGYHYNAHAPAPIQLNDHMIVDAPFSPTAPNPAFPSPSKRVEMTYGGGLGYPNIMDNGYHSSFPLEANTGR